MRREPGITPNKSLHQHPQQVPNSTRPMRIHFPEPRRITLCGPEPEPKQILSRFNQPHMDIVPGTLVWSIPVENLEAETAAKLKAMLDELREEREATKSESV